MRERVCWGDQSQSVHKDGIWLAFEESSFSFCRSLEEVFVCFTLFDDMHHRFAKRKFSSVANLCCVLGFVHENNEPRGAS